VFEKPYLQALYKLHIGYTHCTIPDIFQHLYKSYGKITDNDILDNMESMKAQWDPDTPIEMLYKQIEDGTEYASLAGITIPNKEKVAIAYKLIYQIGELPLACKDWRNKLDSDKTWDNFKTHFISEYQDYKEETNQTTSSTFKANQLLHANTQHMLNQLQHHAQRDENIIDSLREENKALLTKVTSRNDELTNLKSAIEDLKDVVATLTNKENIKPCTMHYYYYYWTHGRIGTKDHTSFNCPNKAKGHRNIATIAYRLLGSNKKCD